MAWKSYGGQDNAFSQSDKDTSWGLIFRLNDIMNAIEKAISKADYDTWNFALDRIFCNISYRIPVKITRDDVSKEITEIKLDKEDTEIYDFLNKKIASIKNAIKKEVNPIVKKKLSHSYYLALTTKDVWIRKKMMELGLYLRETDRDPRKAIYR
jgi:hypothetical protein